MKICVCCSLTFTNEVNEVAKMLEQLGHEVQLLNGVPDRPVDQIRATDAVLVCNFLKDCTPGFIPSDIFVELVLAHYFDKPIFSLFALPDTPYIYDTLRELNITVLDNDLTRFPGSLSYYATSFASEPANTVEPVATQAPTVAPTPELKPEPVAQGPSVEPAISEPEPVAEPVISEPAPTEPSTSEPEPVATPAASTEPAPAKPETQPLADVVIPPAPVIPPLPPAVETTDVTPTILPPAPDPSSAAFGLPPATPANPVLPPVDPTPIVTPPAPKSFLVSVRDNWFAFVNRKLHRTDASKN